MPFDTDVSQIVVISFVPLGPKQLSIPYPFIAHLNLTVDNSEVTQLHTTLDLPGPYAVYQVKITAAGSFHANCEVTQPH